MASELEYIDVPEQGKKSWGEWLMDLLGPKAQGLGIDPAPMGTAIIRPIRRTLQNPVTAATNKLRETVLPTDLWFHGSPKRIEQLAPQLPKRDINTGLGVHFAPDVDTARSFLGLKHWGSKQPTEPTMHTAKILAENPKKYLNENHLAADLLAHGYEQGLVQKSMMRTAQDLMESGDPEQAQAIINALRGRDIGSFISDAVQSNRAEALIQNLTVEEKAQLAKSFIERIGKQEQDAVLYGNLKEGWKLSPTAIVPRKEQIEMVERLPAPALHNLEGLGSLASKFLSVPPDKSMTMQKLIDPIEQYRKSLMLTGLFE